MNDYIEKLENLLDQAKKTETGYAKKWLNTLRNYEKVCIFGAGSHGFNWYNILKKYGIKVDCFYDNDKHKWHQEIIDGVHCAPPPNFSEVTQGKTAIVVALREYEELYRQLQHDAGDDVYVGTVDILSFMSNYEYMGDEKKLDDVFQRMLRILELCQDDVSREICCQTFEKWFIDIKTPIAYHGESYFFTEEVQLSDNECFVDAGAFDGDTIRSFKKAISNHYEKIYTFEMDKRNYQSLKAYCDEVSANNADEGSRIEAYNVGLSDHKGTFRYNSNYESATFSEDGNEICEVDTLDHILKDKKVTFLKMDIEGAELSALHGAKNLIQSQKPKLAICIYHSINDFLNIPVYIKELNPEYNLILRHHSNAEAETVCYAY